MKTSHLLSALLASGFALNAQAVEVFSTNFGTTATTLQVLPATALGTFTSGAYGGAGPTTDASIVVAVAGDAVVRLNQAKYLDLGFTLAAAQSQITVNYWASSSATSSAGNAVVSIDNGTPQTQAITAVNEANPGSPNLGTNIVLTFVGSFAAGAHTVRLDNSVANGFRVDDVTVTAVPEPETYALLMTGLATVGFLVRRRKA